MKKILVSIVALMALANANTNTTVTNQADPFEQMDKIFQMQMKQMELMQKQMDTMFKAFQNNGVNISMPSVSSSGSIFSTGLLDNGDYYELVLNANKDAKLNVNVKAKNGVLNIKVDEKKEVNKKTPYGEVKSYSTSSYMQSFTLPKDADEANIKYENKDNKIIVKIPKKK